MTDVTRPKVKLSLIYALKDRYPEARRYSSTGVVDWALRKLLKETETE